MNKITKNLKLKLGNHVNCDLVYEKGCCKVQPTIKLCDVGVKNGLGLSLAITRSTILSPLNFGVYFKPTFLGEYVETNNKITVNDIFGNQSNYYLVDTPKSLYYNYQNNTKLVKETDNATYSYINDDDQSLTISLNGTNYVTSKFRDVPKFAVSSTGIIQIPPTTGILTSPTANFIKDSSGKITQIEVFSAKQNLIGENKKEIIQFYYSSDAIIQIKFTHIDGTLDTYNFAFYSNQWVLTHDESSMKLEFNFNSSNNVISYKEDYIDANRNDFINTVTCNVTHTIINYPNNKFTYIHFDDNGNSDYEFNDKGIASFAEYSSYKDDYQIKKKSNNFILGKNSSKYTNIAPLSAFVSPTNKWTFTKGNTNSKFTGLLNNNIPYFNVFNTSIANIVTIDSSDNAAKLSTEITQNFSNKKFVFSTIYNVKSSGSAANFEIKFKPYYNGSAISGVISRTISTSIINDYRFICEEVFFEKNVDKIIIEISFKAGQKIEFYDLHFIEHPYGKTYYRDLNNLVYKTVDNYEVVRVKNHDFIIRNIGFDKVNLFIEKDKNVNDLISTVHLSQYAKKVVEQNNEGNVVKEETIYKKGNTEEILQKTYSYDAYNMLYSQFDYNQILTNYSYYLNTDLLSEASSFDTKTKFTYADKQVNTSFVLKNNESNILYSTNHLMNVDSLTSSLSEINKTPFVFSYNFMKNLTSCSLGNLNVESNTYVDSQNYPYEILASKTINGQSFDFIYNDEDLVTEIENTTTNSVFGFEYDDLNNITKVTNSDASVEQFSYDEDNNLIENTYKELKITNKYENGKNIIKSYDFNNENYQNIVTCNNENANSEIVNNILTRVADSDRYVGLFDRTVCYEKTNNNFNDNVARFCSLIKTYYNEHEEVAPQFIGNGGNQTQRISQGLSYCIVDNHKYLQYNKLGVTRKKGTFRGSVGGLYEILNMDNYMNLTSILINDLYVINLFVDRNDNQTLRIRIENIQSGIVMTEFATDFAPAVNFVGYFNLSYSISNSDIKLNLLTDQGSINFERNISFSLSSTAKISFAFNRIKNLTDSNSHLKITSILADFDVDVPLNIVIEHFNLVYRAYLLSTTLATDNYYSENSSSNINYSKINSNIRLLTFKNTLKDTHNNSPLEYLNGEKLFGYGGIELGNCYYSYGMPLLYQTNLSNKGRIIFKSKIISSLHQDQCYFVLYNDSTTIKLKFTAYETLALEVNGVSKSILSSSNFFTKPHQIDFEYSLNNGSLTYTFNFGNNHIVNGNISFTESSSTASSDFKLLIGSDNTRKTIKDLDNNNFSIKKELFNGFISDLIYFSTDDNSIAYNELEELKTPVISYTSSDIFERKNESKIYYKNKNVISKKIDYLKNDKYITPFLKEEKILLNSSTNNFSGTLNRRYLYSYEGAYENAPKYKNIYGYEEDTTVSGENVAQVYKREYEYTEGSNFIKKEIIKKGSISNGEFIQTNKWQVDYTYNNNNCLTSVKTTYNDSSITTNSFTYSSSFPHLLTYNNSNSFVYDGLYLKQIKNYMGQVIKQFNYIGTKISSIQEPLQNKTIIFDYDYRGRRTKKLNQTSNDLVEYYYNGNILIREKHSNYYLNFLYNENNELIGFEHISSNNSAKTKYFYLRNAFNDIVEVLDENGNLLVHYLYDAFGNTVETIDNSSISLGMINPFRYRGYYYDVETQLYWVSSRYYSSELCRWILPDCFCYLNPTSINGLNLYNYCYNDPINYIDNSGCYPVRIQVGRLTIYFHSPHGNGPNAQRHIHIKNGNVKIASRNYDGSVHDKKYGKNYVPSKEVYNALLEQGWDWYGNKFSLFDFSGFYRDEFPLQQSGNNLEQFPVTNIGSSVEVFPSLNNGIVLETFPQVALGTPYYNPFPITNQEKQILVVTAIVIVAVLAIALIPVTGGGSAVLLLA